MRAVVVLPDQTFFVSGVYGARRWPCCGIRPCPSISRACCWMPAGRSSDGGPAFRAARPRVSRWKPRTGRGGRAAAPGDPRWAERGLGASPAHDTPRDAVAYRPAIALTGVNAAERLGRCSPSRPRRDRPDRPGPPRRRSCARSRCDARSAGPHSNAPPRRCARCSRGCPAHRPLVPGVAPLPCGQSTRGRRVTWGVVADDLEEELCAAGVGGAGSPPHREFREAPRSSRPVRRPSPAVEAPPSSIPAWVAQVLEKELGLSSEEIGRLEPDQARRMADEHWSRPRQRLLKEAGG